MSMMLPSPPKTLGMLGDVLISSLQSLKGETNTLDFRKAHSICVLLVDGLGTHNLSEAGGHARFLNSLNKQKISCFFPSTTSTSLSSFATGLPPSETGFIAYQIFNRSTNEAMNLLSGWLDQESAMVFQPKKTISEATVEAGFQFHVCSQAVYEFSGLTAATMREAEFHSSLLISERFSKASQLLAGKEQKIIYLYVPELDQIAHAHGVRSTRWLQAIEELDAEIQKLSSKLGEGNGLVITADHGVIDIPFERHFYLDDLIPEHEVHFVGGDTRGLTLYLKDQSQVELWFAKLTDSLAGSCYVVRPQDLVSSGYMSSLGDRPELIPDLWIIAKSEIALFHRSFARKRSMANIGHHGGFTDRELSIPLIKLGV